MGFGGPEKLARMRLKHHHASQPVCCSRFFQHFEQQRLMAAMDPVEIPDSDRCALEFSRYVLVAVNDAHARETI
jgi:hypothetical protein